MSMPRPRLASMPKTPKTPASSRPDQTVPRSRLIRPDSQKATTKSAASSTPVPAKATPRSLCPISLALEWIGDAWTLLIIRDLMLRGHSSYQAFLRSGEGIATNILADRLQKLEQNGLLTKSADPADARKFIYALSERGADLAPILVELALFGQTLAPRVEMPKDVLADMNRNKQAFATRLRKNSAPKAKPRAKTTMRDPVADEETLSLF